MATLLKSRAEPLQFDLANLEKDPGAILGYHQEIHRRIVSLLPPLEAVREGLESQLERLRVAEEMWYNRSTDMKKR